MLNLSSILKQFKSEPKVPTQEYNAVLVRLKETTKQSLGRLTLFKGLDKVFECTILELPYKDNKKFESSIPLGEYLVRERYSDKYARHFAVLDVEGREYILMHSGNYYTQTDGCLITGTDFVNPDEQDFQDINNDGELDVVGSRKALDTLLASTNTFKLKIIEV